MKTSLSHLPLMKQEQIKHITEIIREVADPEKIILFGSYAKDEYVEHRYTGRDGIRYEYISDYDFLVVMKNNIVKEYELDDIITNRSRMYRPSVNLEIHEIDHINKGLEFGQYFFADIIKEGILLYDKGTVSFAQPRELTPDEVKEISLRYFDQWFTRGIEFAIDSRNAFARKSLNNSVFHLHQSAESFYYTALLVFTGYKPKVHNLGKLRNRAKHLSEELFWVFPIEGNKHEKHLFDLLKRGYVDARYKANYVITEAELIELTERVKKMQNIVEKMCKEYIHSL